MRKKELSENVVTTSERAVDEHIEFDEEFSVVLPTLIKENEMHVVNRRKLLPEVTIGLTKEEASKLAKVLSESNVEIKFCLDLLADIDLVALEEKVINNK
ncbi:MAG: hypothetical protein ACE5KZ_14375 [Candidatus Scalinduaceae bacterium]